MEPKYSKLHSQQPVTSTSWVTDIMTKNETVSSAASCH